MPEPNEIQNDRTAPDNSAINQLLELLEKTDKELDEQPSLEEKQEYGLKVLNEILNWNLEHGYFETLFPIFQEFIHHLPECRLNTFLQELKKYSRLRYE